MKPSEEKRRLTFSQREGLAPLPGIIRLGYVSKDFRHIVWLVVDTAIRHEAIDDDRYYKDASISMIIRSYFFMVHQWPHDQIQHTPIRHRGYLRDIILEGKYHELLTLVEFMVSHKHCSAMLRQVLEDAFRKGRLAYAIQEIGGKPTVIPRVSEEYGRATQKAIETIAEKAPLGARSHMRAAATAINEGRFADTVRECIHAVESVARTIDPKAGKSLGPALKSLESAGVLNHPALKAAFINLYGYTNDESGIRHALLAESAPEVDINDAVFMFGACACFAAYLINKREDIEN